MNWSYLQEWALSLIFFAPALVILALTLMALPLAKGAQFAQKAEMAKARRSELEGTASGKERAARMHLHAHHSPPGDEVAEETA